MAWQQQQYNQQYQMQQRPNAQQYQQYMKNMHSQSVRSLNQQPAYNQQYNQQQYNQYYANQQRQQQQHQQPQQQQPQQQQQPPQQQRQQQQQQYNQYGQQQQRQRLMNAYGSSQPPVASPFLQAQQQKQQQLRAQQQGQHAQQWNAPQQPGGNNAQKLIADSTPPPDEDQTQTQPNAHPSQNNYYYNQYNDNMATAQQRMKELIASQEKMIDEFRKNEESLRKQLQERDDNWRQTLTNSLNKKDLRINELFQETLDLQQQNKGEQMKNVELQQVIMELREESSRMLFSSPDLPGLPPPPPIDAIHANDSIPEDKESEEQKEIKKEDAIEKPKGEDVVETQDVPKESKKQALEALFAAKKNTKDTVKTDGVNPALAKYIKMKKLNMPMRNILNKMKMDGVDKELIAEFKGEKKKEKKVNIEDNPALQKYVKMKKIGMPMVSVINKMRMDGIDKALIAAFNGETNDDEEEEDNGPKIDLNDPKFDKYKKMKKLNMPINSVINKMRMDGLNKDEIEAFTGNGAPKKKTKKKTDKRTQMQQLALAMGLKPKEAAVPQRVKKLKRIHWKVIELKDIKGTFWEQINKNYDDDNEMKLGAKFELEFQIRARKPRHIARHKSKMSAILNLHGRSGKKTKKKDRITWIAGKRDQNIQIGLKTLGINNEEIYDAIVDMDNKTMTTSRLDTIFELTPSMDEQRKAEEKIDALGDDVEFCGPSELFHIEMSSIPEVRTQVTKWLFCRTFKELYMDRLQQVTNIIKGCYAIKESLGLQIYLRILLQMGNLMNHGVMDKGMVYGFDLESLTLLDNIKNFGGNKTLAMYLYEYAYNKYPSVRTFEEELSVLKVAARTETAAIETSIKQMADEFLNIDLFCRRINDEYHPGDTEAFREYMKKFSDLQTVNMMNLKVKIQNAQSIAKNVASYYGITLEEGKPEILFQTVQRFVNIMDKSKRALLKLEKERQKINAKIAKEKEKKKKKGKGGKLKKMKLTVSELMSRKKGKQMEQEEKGNMLFHDIKMAAAKFSQRQKKMETRLSTHFTEKIAMAKGEMTDTMKNDKIKKRVSQQMGIAPMISAEEAEKLRGINEDQDDDEFDDHELQLKQGGGNSLMVPESPI